LNIFSRIPSSSLKTLKDIRMWIGDNILKLQKESRIYSNKIPIYTNTNLPIKKIERVNNEILSLDRMVLKPLNGMYMKKIITYNFNISRCKNREQEKEKDKEKDKINMLPKMKISGLSMGNKI
jgi:hypothetical protein